MQQRPSINLEWHFCEAWDGRKAWARGRMARDLSRHLNPRSAQHCLVSAPKRGLQHLQDCRHPRHHAVRGQQAGRTTSMCPYCRAPVSRARTGARTLFITTVAQPEMRGGTRTFDIRAHAMSHGTPHRDHHTGSARAALRGIAKMTEIGIETDVETRGTARGARTRPPDPTVTVDTTVKGTTGAESIEGDLTFIIVSPSHIVDEHGMHHVSLLRYQDQTEWKG